MSKIIIGIHGLANKPPKGELEKGWVDAIMEGLDKNCGGYAPEFDYEMVYWADLLYLNQLHDKKDYDFDDLYNTQPYVAAAGPLREYKDGFLDTARRLGSSLVGGGIDFAKETFGIERLANWVLEKTLKDLAFYYSKTRQLPGRV